MMGLACLFMVACNNAPKQEQKPDEQPVVAEEHHCPFCPLKAEYANWDNMDETAKAELNKKAYDLFAEMDAKMAECEAKKAECEAKGEGKPCCKEGEEHKCNHEGEHKCNHEGEHKCNHEGEHKCNHEGEAKPCCKEGMPELTEEQKAECEAKCAEMKALMEKWGSFETLSLDEQKDLVLGRIAAMGMGGEKCNHEGEEHQCQHEGEEGHQCQHAE